MPMNIFIYDIPDHSEQAESLEESHSSSKTDIIAAALTDGRTGDFGQAPIRLPALTEPNPVAKSHPTVAGHAGE